MLRPDGSIVWLYDKGQVSFDASGQPLQMSGVAMDITARKQAEARERRYLNRLKQLTAASPLINSTLSLDNLLQLIADKSREIIEAHMAIVHITLDGNWTSANSKISLSKKYAQWRDYQASLDGSGIYHIVCQNQQPMRLTQAQLEAHPAWHSFGKAASKHPPLRGWLAAPVTFVNGKSLGIIQLSDKYEGEFTEEDENILAQLGHMVGAAIDNARLYEESQQANRVKDEFLAILSHELRSPLNAILGWSKLLLSRQLEPAATRRALETIERNARLQTQLIGDLLDVSRILQGKLRLNVCPVNLTVSIEAAIDTMSLAAQSKSIQIKSVLDPTVGLVLGDASRLQQVVWNLLANAIKFTPNGGRVEVRLEVVNDWQMGRWETRGPHSAKGVEIRGNGEKVESNSPHHPTTPSLDHKNRYAQITVKDTGIGIKPQFLPHVFDYFRQADGSITRNHGGLGLGLAITRHIVELHGGTVSAESPGEGQGATFTVRLPLLPTAPSPHCPITQSPHHPISQFPLAGLRVLVVDDELDSREFLVFALEEYGAVPMAVSSAEQALQALHTFKPDVLLSDIGTPETDGYTLVRKIRQMKQEQGGKIPAIALTAYAREEDKNRAISAGFEPYCQTSRTNRVSYSDSRVNGEQGFRRNTLIRRSLIYSNLTTTISYSSL